MSDWLYSLATPAKVSAALSLLNIAPIIGSTTTALSAKLWMIAGNVLVALVWIFVIDALYKSGYTTISWLLAIGGPLIVLLLFIFYAFSGGSYV